MNITYAASEKQEAMAAVAAVLMVTTNQPEALLHGAVEAVHKCEAPVAIALISRSADGASKTFTLASGQGRPIFSETYPIGRKPPPHAMN